MSDTKEATRFSFWMLIKEHSVVIPNLQRDYALGRGEAKTIIDQKPKGKAKAKKDQKLKGSVKPEDPIGHIRTDLINAIFEAVCNKKPLALNFVYGVIDDKKGETEFHPIDGQQRLTTLFLLHWYIFRRTDYKEGLEKLKRFSYETRNTSKRFCKFICQKGLTSVDFRKDKISEQIKNCSWFTGSFDADPTIKSMLVVLDGLHSKFINTDESQINQIKTALIALDDCPITFLWLPMENSEQVNDLYIKMNARGKLLTDFEIFKAELQHDKTLLDDVVSSVNERVDSTDFISKFNNEYAELFYKYFGINYDNALWDFIKEVLRDKYLSLYVSNNKDVARETCQSEYNLFKGMNGSGLFNHLKERNEVWFKNGIVMVYNLLMHFDNEFKKDVIFEEECKIYDNTPSLIKTVFEDRKQRFDESKNLQIDNRDGFTLNLNSELALYSLYSFINKFGIPSDVCQKEAYAMWRRFVYNIKSNVDFQNSGDVCKAFYVFDYIINSIKDYDKPSLLEELAKFRENSSIPIPPAMKNQFEEEAIKASLRLDPKVGWEETIHDAESYFEGGGIGFILDWSKVDNNYDIDIFKKYFKYLKDIFESDKKLKTDIKSYEFEQAMLCLHDEASEEVAEKGHLKFVKGATWQFIGCDYNEFAKHLLVNDDKDKKRRDPFKKLIDRLLDSNNETNVELQKIKDEFIENVKSGKRSLDAKHKWKERFIFDNFLFTKTIPGFGSTDVPYGYYINFDNDNKIIRLIKGKTLSSKGTELYTYLLYLIIKEVHGGTKVKLEFDDTSRICDDTEFKFPLRHIKINNNIKIGYDSEVGDFGEKFLYKDGENNSVLLTKDEIFARLRELGLLKD